MMMRQIFAFAIALALAAAMLAGGATAAGLPLAPQQAALPAGTATALPSESDTPPAQDQDGSEPVLAYAGPGWG